MAFIITEQCVRSNMLPTWRTLHLNYIRQLRSSIRHIRSGLQRGDAAEYERVLRRAQQRAANDRQRWFAAA